MQTMTMKQTGKRFAWFGTVALCGALWACTSLQQRDRYDTERSARKTTASKRLRMPDKPAPPATVVDGFNDGHSPAPDQYSPEQRTTGLDRASSVSARVDSIVVTPAALSMAAGDTLSLRGKAGFTWVAKDTSRHEVKNFWPLFSVSDSTVLRVEHWRLTALKPGVSDLLVSAVKSDSTSRTPRVLRTTRVHVVVK